MRLGAVLKRGKPLAGTAQDTHYAAGHAGSLLEDRSGGSLKTVMAELYRSKRTQSLN